MKTAWTIVKITVTMTAGALTAGALVGIGRWATGR